MSRFKNENNISYNISQANSNKTRVHMKVENDIESVDNATDISKKRESQEDDIQIDLTGVYRFKDSGIGDSWLIGTDIYTGTTSEHYANAFVEGINGCTPVLNIPGTLTDSNGKTKAVEIIGRGAFIFCGYKRYNGKTEILKVPRQVKIIKYCGLADMHDVKNFEIEAGSVLETIEENGLAYIGYNSPRIGTLILPSTLSYVEYNGINTCNLIHTTIYCGSHLLSNFSPVETVSRVKYVKVTSLYPSGQKVLGRNPDTYNQIATEVTCSLMAFPNLKNLRRTSSGRIFSRLWVIAFNLVL